MLVLQGSMMAGIKSDGAASKSHGMERNMKATPCRALITILFLSAWAASVHAEIPLKLYEGMKADDTFKIYIGGVAQGYAWSNTILKSYRHQDELFCAPYKLRLSKENYLSILDDYIAKHDVKTIYGEDGALEFVLLMALREVFPCQQKTGGP